MTIVGSLDHWMKGRQRLKGDISADLVIYEA